MADDKNEKSSVPHQWRFARVGGFDQVRLETGADLLALDQLDQKLWASLACPTHGLELDSKTLELIDSDGDGRIRVPEILAAVKWIGSVLKNADDLTKRADTLPLSAIDESTPEGGQLLASAKQILVNLGKPDATFVTPEDTADTVKIFAQTKFNGDGIIPVEATDDEQLKNVIKEIMECMGSESTAAVNPASPRKRRTSFIAELQDYADWWRKAEDDAANILVVWRRDRRGSGSLQGRQGQSGRLLHPLPPGGVRCGSSRAVESVTGRVPGHWPVRTSRRLPRRSRRCRWRPSESASRCPWKEASIRRGRRGFRDFARLS